MKKKGFTLVELLVVIAIIAMLLAILMPALGKVRQLAQRIMCGTNVGGIGKAMLTYAADDEYESSPIAGGGSAKWDVGTGGNEGYCTWAWNNKDAVPGDSANPASTLSANLYLLVKYGNVTPEQFICPGGDEKKFELSKYDYDTTEAETLTDLWDFGDERDEKTDGLRGRGHNSYSYQYPLPIDTDDDGYPISASSDPTLAVLADRNPFWDVGNVATNPDFVDLYEWDTTANEVKRDSIPFGNAKAHQQEGQNVGYVDQHVKFEKMANCGIDNDNIYTTWGVASRSEATDEMVQCGKTPKPSQTNPSPPENKKDGYLVNDWN